MPSSGLLEPIEREFSVELEKKLGDYVGKWVVILDSEIVAVGDTPSLALEEATERVSKEADLVLHRVPDDSNTAYFF